MSMKKKKDKIPNYLMFAQATVDFYQAAVAWYETIVDAQDEEDPYVHKMSEITCTMLFEYSLALCLLTLLLASIERYLSIAKPFFHKKFVTKTRTVYGSLCVWVVSLMAPFSLICAAGFDSRKLNSSSVILYSYVFDAILFTVIIVIITTLALSLKIGNDSMNAGIRNQQQCRLKRTGESVHRMMRKKVRLAIIFSIMMSVFLVSFLPFAIGRLLYDAGLLRNLSMSQQGKILATCHIVYKSSSLFNPLLTLTLKDDYRKVLLKYLRWS